MNKSQTWEETIIKKFRDEFSKSDGEDIIFFDGMSSTQAFGEVEDFIAQELSLKDQEIVKLKADIAHAIGFCRGLGHPETYLEKQYPELKGK